MKQVEMLFLWYPAMKYQSQMKKIDVRHPRYRAALPVILMLLLRAARPLRIPLFGP